MTEQEWLISNDVSSMIMTATARWRKRSPYTQEDISIRKLRLWAVACCNSLPVPMPESARVAIEAAERLADEGSGNIDDLLNRTLRDGPVYHWVAPVNQFQNVPTHWPDRFVYHLMTRANTPEQNRQYCDLLRDIAGNPYRPCRVTGPNRSGGCLDLENDHPILDVTVRPHPGSEFAHYRPIMEGRIYQAALEMYQAKDFACLGVLADMLEDTRACNQMILDHLRSEGTHVRGCWAIDLILGKH